MDTPLVEYLLGLSLTKLRELYEESCVLDATGILPMNAGLRTISRAAFTTDTVLQMIMVGREVYKLLAARYIQNLENAYVERSNENAY